MLQSISAHPLTDDDDPYKSVIGTGVGIVSVATSYWSIRVRIFLWPSRK